MSNRRPHSFRAATDEIDAYLVAPGRKKSERINDALRYVMTRESDGLEIEDVQTLLIDLRRELSAIGNNLNQIAKGIHIANNRGDVQEGLDGLVTEWEELRKVAPELRRAIQYWS